MKGIEVKSFDKPDETRPFQGKGYADMVTLGGKAVLCGHFEPCWRWSVNVKHRAGIDAR